MKNLIRPLILFAAVTLIFSSCKKEDTAASLAGEWEVLSVKLNGVDQAFPSTVYTMTDCERGSRCEAMINKSGAVQVVEVMMSQDGSQFFVYQLVGGSSPDDQVFDVDEHTHASFVISEFDPVSNDVTTTTMQHIN